MLSIFPIHDGIENSVHTQRDPRRVVVCMVIKCYWTVEQNGVVRPRGPTLHMLTNIHMLSSLIQDKYERLGETDAGSNWCHMALNPAAGPLELRGIPDADSFPCVCMDYESVVSIPAPSPSGLGAWKCVMDVLAHPVQPVSFRTINTGGLVQYGGVVNPTLMAAASYSEYTIAFARLCNSFRMLYCGVTVDLDASALNNAGSVVAGQFPLEYQRLNYALPRNGACISYAHILNANYTTNFPDQAISQLPGAYMGLAKDGLYLPLKLDPLAPWMTTLNAELCAVANPGSAQSPTLSNVQSLTLPNTTPVGGDIFPFYGSPYYGNPHPLIGAWAFSDETLNGDVAIPLQQTNMGHIVFYNMVSAASLTVKVRWGVEMRVEPTSFLAPALQPSAKHDALALTAYSDIAGSLPWAYPSAYNANGKLMEIIKKAWNVIKPVAATGLGLIPHPAAQAAGALISKIPSFERPPNQSSQSNGKRAPKRRQSRAGKVMPAVATKRRN